MPRSYRLITYAVCCKGGVSSTFDNAATFRTSSTLPKSFGPHLILPVFGRSTMVLTDFFLLSIRKCYPILSKGSLMECEVSNFRNRVRNLLVSPYGLFGLGRRSSIFATLLGGRRGGRCLRGMSSILQVSRPSLSPRCHRRVISRFPIQRDGP
jgi:hypothetical protein